MPILTVDAPDSVVYYAEFIVDTPDRVVCLSELVVDMPDCIITADLVCVDAPDRVSCIAYAIVDAPDGIVVGSVPLDVAQALSNVPRHIQPLAYARLLYNGAAVDWESLSLSWGVKKGWSWDATLPHSSLDLYGVGLWQIIIVDGLGNALESPPLIGLPCRVVDVRSESSPSATVSGVDATTYRMGVKNKSFTTFKHTTAAKILKILADSEGLQISGVEDFPVPDEDTKQMLLADAINRFVFTSAQEWLVTESGKIQLCKWKELAGGLEVDWSTIVHNVDLRKRFTSIKIGKRSALQGGGTAQGSQDYAFNTTGPRVVQLTTPLYNPQASNRSTVGFIDLVCFYDGDPTKPGSACIAMFTWNQGLGLNLPPATPNGNAATHFSCYVFNANGTVQILVPGLDPSRVLTSLHVTGTPPAVQAQMAGTEPEFLYPYDTGITPAWPAPDWTDNLPPSKAWAISHAPDYLNLINKGWDTLEMNAVCHAGVKLRQAFPYGGNVYKVDSISWHCGNGAPTTDIGLVRL